MARGAKTGGRRKGTPNKFTGEVKTMIRAALEKAGGVDYLVEQAEKSPASFLALVGKTLPHEVTGKDGGDLKAKVTVEFVSKAA